MKILAPVLVLLATTCQLPLATAADHFPVGPDAQLTPGSLCGKKPGSHLGYPEKISICKRNVSSETKKQIMETYDAELGFTVMKMKRADFKIDHYIPLCMGGSNLPTNLWPQHKSVYAITDPIEGDLCIKMAQGKILQADAIEIIKRAKADLAETASLIKYVEGL